MVRTCRSGGLARRGRCSGGQAQRGRGDVGPVVWLGVDAPRTQRLRRHGRAHAAVVFFLFF